MIIFSINGGLGNQMFQYATTLAMKENTGHIVKLDISNFENYNLHNGFELNRIFNISTEIATNEDLKRVLGCIATKPIRTVFRKFCKGKVNSKYYVEPNLSFSNKLADICDNTLVEGYWQSEKYFNKVADKIREEFTFKLLLKDKNIELSELIKSSESVSLHIRRGDYISNKNNKIYYQCPAEYYLSAINMLTQHLNKPVFYVFSDDILWAKNNLKSAHEFIFIDNNKAEDSYIDMQLMSLCKHNIIANSTFSWWGAWLNSNSEKMVISPKEWFINGQTSDDIIPEKWIRL